MQRCDFITWCKMMRIQRTDKSVLKRFLKKLAHKINWLFSLFKKKKINPHQREEEHAMTSRESGRLKVRGARGGQKRMA